MFYTNIPRVCRRGLQIDLKISEKNKASFLESSHSLIMHTYNLVQITDMLFEKTHM